MLLKMRLNTFSNMNTAVGKKKEKRDHPDDRTCLFIGFTHILFVLIIKRKWKST
jgi:hypothetical protein